MRSKVSVVIPTYNYAHYLDETIQSVLNQTFKEFELIIVDNCSTDNTEEVVARYLKDPRVSFHRNETNLGIVGNWNKCLDYVTSDYIKYLCADDRFHPELLEKFYKVMEENPSVSLITCDKQLFGAQPWYVELPLKHLHKGKDAIVHTLETKCWIGEPTSVMFRTANLELGKFRHDFKLYIDWEFWLRHLVVGDCYIIPEALAYVRAHPGQHTHVVKDASCFEEYRMVNILKENKDFYNGEYVKKLDRIIREKAAVCAKQGMFKQIPRLMKPKNRKMFFEGLSIALKEKSFGSGLKMLFEGAMAKSKAKKKKNLSTS